MVQGLLRIETRAVEGTGRLLGTLTGTLVSLPVQSVGPCRGDLFLFELSEAIIAAARRYLLHLKYFMLL